MESRSLIRIRSSERSVTDAWRTPPLRAAAPSRENGVSGGLFPVLLRLLRLRDLLSGVCRDPAANGAVVHQGRGQSLVGSAAVLHWRCVCVCVSPPTRTRRLIVSLTCARQSAGIYAAFVVLSVAGALPQQQTGSSALWVCAQARVHQRARAQIPKFAGEAKREETVSLKQGRLRASGLRHRAGRIARKCFPPSPGYKRQHRAPQTPRAPTPTRARTHARPVLRGRRHPNPARACASSRRP